MTSSQSENAEPSTQAEFDNELVEEDKEFSTPKKTITRHLEAAGEIEISQNSLFGTENINEEEKEYKEALLSQEK